MLELSIFQGQSLGPFSLGTLVNDVIQYLKDHIKEFPCVEVTQASQDIHFLVPDHGFKLVFDKRSQRLRCIEVCDPSRLRLRCGPGAVFGGAAHPPTYSGLYSAFGPTLESDIDLSTGLQPLLYPGLVALFEPDCAAGNGRSSADKFIPPTGPATSIYIFSGSATSVAGALASSPPLRLGAGASPVAEVVLGKGAWFAGGRCTVRLGDAAQEIVAELGEPDAVHHKPLLNKTEGASGDYFFNYFARGLDVMVSGQSHTVLKLIFHTNPAMHPDFGRYQKSNFRLHVSGDFALPAYALDASGGAEEGMADAGPADAGQPWDVDRDGEESLALELEADGSPVPERDIENGRGASGADGVVSPSRLSAACNMLADLMDGAFGGTSDSESPPPEPVPRSSKKKKKKGKKGSNTAASTAGDDSPAQYYSAGTSPATHQSFIHAASGLPPRTPGAGLGSAHSSAANLARNERRWEVGSSYRDGWSDGEDLTQLVGATGEESSTSPRNRERRTCQADASVQASFPYEATDDEGGHVGLMMGGELGDEEANGSPSSYVQVESEPKFGIEDSTDFENIPQMRTCSTQTAKVAALTPARYPWPAGTGRTSGGPSAPTTGVVVVVGADDTLEDIEAAMGPLGKGAVSPQGMATGAGPGFPPSRLFGYPGVVFEVLPCGSIASLTLFKAS